MNVLVTGAAGYIGSIVTEQLLHEGHSVVAVDNLTQGHREAVHEKAEFVEADLANAQALDGIFGRHSLEAVVHLAADSIVGQSMTDPGRVFRNNVINGMNLVDTMLRHGVGKLVFSSSAAVYGEPEEVPIGEDCICRPVNPYGESKLILERILHWYGRAYGLTPISLRYFNAAGASDRFGEDHDPETHLIPNVLKVALGQVDEVSVFGTDYDTRDGTCIRDYVHVTDIARAHVLSLKRLDRDGVCEVYNVGNGMGYSVLEVIEAARKVTGVDIRRSSYPRRQGDPAALVAGSELARSVLGWQPEFSDIEIVVKSAWDWQKNHPYGYAPGEGAESSGRERQ